MKEEVFFPFSFNQIAAQTPASALWIAFLIAGGLLLVAALALLFHWNKYKLHSPATDVTQIVYLAGLFILVALSAASLIFFNMQ